MDVSILNGQPGHLSLNHRSAAYGDGVFETIWFNGSELHFLREHFDRLLSGASALKLVWSRTQNEEVLAQLQAYMADAFGEHVAKVMLLRNSAGRGYSFNEEEQSVDCVIQIKPYEKPSWAAKGAMIKTAKTPVSVNKKLAGLKHCNRLDSVMARSEYSQEEANEVLLLDNRQHIVEGSMSNVFMKLDDQWLTPRLETSGVRGIIRNKLIADFEVRETELTYDQLPAVSAAFICNSLIGIVPVLSIDKFTFNASSDVEMFNQKLGFV